MAINAIMQAAELTTPTIEDLQMLYRQGMQRYGIVAAIINEQNELLVLGHNSNDKIASGQLGALGETSLVTVGAEPELEPTTVTLLRGIREELGIELDAADLLVSPRRSYTNATWLIGTEHTDRLAWARCPIVFVTAETEDRLLDAPATAEVIGREFMPVEEVYVDANRASAQNLASYRLGMTGWLSQVMRSLTVIHNDHQQLVPLKEIYWEPNGPTQDAIFANMFGSAS